jgi:hypothetical protein
MSRKGISAALAGLGAVAAVAWLVEALTVGRGVAAAYLAPVAILAPVLAVLISRKRRD